MDPTNPVSATTEKGAPSLETTGKPLLDLFFKLTRNIPEDEIVRMIRLSFPQHPLETMRILFHARDCRGGKGDRKPFLAAMLYIADTHPTWFLANLEHIPTFGRWLDLVELYSQVPQKDEIVLLILKQLQQDISDIIHKKPISLLAKWLPGEKKRWDTGIRESIIRRFYNLDSDKPLNTWHQREFRKLLTPLRNHIDLVETRMCKNQWSEIVYSHVPGVAMTDFSHLFKKHDEERFTAYLEDVANNKTKINATVVYPHVLVEKYFEERHFGVNPVLEEQWRALASTISIHDATVVSDVSGSMEGTPMSVSIALGILLAQLNTSASFKNKLFTFSDTPTLIDIGDCPTLLKKIQKVADMNWGTSTNLEAVFVEILRLCIQNDEAPPSKVIVFSDMQFDKASKTKKTNFDNIRDMFAANSLPCPELIFWNLRGDTRDFPVNGDTPGITLLSGFSPMLLNTITTGKTITPYEILRQVIDSPRYAVIQAPNPTPNLEPIET